MSPKDKIMDVALKLFAERGYEAVSIRDLCSEVGINEKALHREYTL